MRALLATLLVVPLVAFGEWKSMGSRGTTVNDVEVVDAGQVLLATSGTGGMLTLLQLEADGGVTTVLELDGGTSGFNGGRVFGGCMVGGTTGGSAKYTDAGCGMDAVLPGSNPRGFRGFGTNGLVSLDGVGPVNFRVATVGGAFALITPFGVAGVSPVIRTHRIGTVDLIGVNTASPPAFRLSVDGGALSATTYPFGAYTDFSLFQRGPSASLAATNATSILVFDDAFVPDASVADTSSFGGALPRQISVGTDVAMAITNTSALASPVPNPANPLAVWRLRRNSGITWGTHVDCLESRWCAANDTSGNVWIYENANTPTVQALPTIVADAGTVVRVVLDAGDLDDDILFHSWDAGGRAVVINASGFDDGVGVDLSFFAGLCGPQSVSVTTTDGLNSVTTPVNVTLVGRGDVQIFAPPMPPVAGAGPVMFSAFVDGGCDSASFTWNTSSQAMAGDAFNYQPAATWCGGSDTITVTATWAGGGTSTFMVNTTPVPWGTPFTPTFPMPAVQASGTSRVWSPVGPQHVCEGDGGFPGIELLWDLPIDAGPGVTATPVDGGLRVDAVSVCLPSQFSATARAQVVNEQFGRVSTRGTLTVDLTPDIVPLDSTTMFTLTAGNDGGVVVGDTTVNVTCELQRALKTDIEVLEGANVVASARFVAPGPYALSVPGGCAGGSREVVAHLLENDLDTGAERRQMVMFDPTPAAVGAMTPTSLTARCGEGVRGQLRLEPAPGACMAVQNDWRQVDGSPLDVTQGAGVIDVSTTALDLSMVGQQLTFEWTVDGGAGNSATAQRTVDIGVEPFVAVSARTFPIQRREESAFDVEVVLTNGTECAVDSLDVTVPVSGGAPIAGTLVVDGARFDSTVEGTSLRASGVSLAASGRAVLRFSATPRLLGSPSATPEVTLRGLPVSIAEPTKTQPSGCGCQTTPAITLVLLAFFALGRRRRRA